MEKLAKGAFEQKVVKSKKMVVVDFSGENCQPCQRLKPILERIVEKYKGNEYIEFFLVDMEEDRELFSRFSVMTVPHLVFFYKGRAVDELVGLRSEDTILDFIKRNVVELSKPEYLAE